MCSLVSDDVFYREYVDDSDPKVRATTMKMLTGDPLIMRQEVFEDGALTKRKTNGLLKYDIHQIRSFWKLAIEAVGMYIGTTRSDSAASLGSDNE